MGQLCDCLCRTHQHNRLNEIEENIFKYEQFMEQWLVNNEISMAIPLYQCVGACFQIIYTVITLFTNV